MATLYEETFAGSADADIRGDAPSTQGSGVGVWAGSLALAKDGSGNSGVLSGNHAYGIDCAEGAAVTVTMELNWGAGGAGNGDTVAVLLRGNGTALGSLTGYVVEIRNAGAGTPALRVRRYDAGSATVVENNYTGSTPSLPAAIGDGVGGPVAIRARIEDVSGDPTITVSVGTSVAGLATVNWDGSGQTTVVDTDANKIVGSTSQDVFGFVTFLTPDTSVANILTENDATLTPLAGDGRVQALGWGG